MPNDQKDWVQTLTPTGVLEEDNIRTCEIYRDLAIKGQQGEALTPADLTDYSEHLEHCAECRQWHAEQSKQA